MNDDDRDPDQPERPISAELPWIGLFAVVLAFTVFALAGGVNRLFQPARSPVVESPAAEQPATAAAPVRPSTQ